VTSPPKKPIVAAKGKWQGEDEEDSGPASDWEESSSEDEDPQPAPATTTTPPKKKGNFKAKIAEKTAAKAARQDASDDEYSSDEVLDPTQKARLEKQREVNEDLKNAQDLFGPAASGEKSALDNLLSFQPRTKEDFQELSKRVIECVLKKHQNKPLYPAFVEYHVRQLAIPLKDVEVRKAASGLTTLANEKQKEQREKASGKKKSKAASRPTLGPAKLTKHDTRHYDALDGDFGNNADDFM